MPIYGYRCSSCGHELEVFQSMSDAPLRLCAECGGALSKLLYPVGVQFKGSGFYTTDYRYASRGGGERNGSSSAARGEGGTSDSSSSSSSSSSSGASGKEGPAGGDKAAAKAKGETAAGSSGRQD